MVGTLFNTLFSNFIRVCKQILSFERFKFHDFVSPVPLAQILENLRMAPNPCTRNWRKRTQSWIFYQWNNLFVNFFFFNHICIALLWDFPLYFDYFLIPLNKVSHLILLKIRTFQTKRNVFKTHTNINTIHTFIHTHTFIYTLPQYFYASHPLAQFSIYSYHYVWPLIHENSCCLALSYWAPVICHWAHWGGFGCLALIYNLNKRNPSQESSWHHKNSKNSSWHHWLPLTSQISTGNSANIDFWDKTTK